MSVAAAATPQDEIPGAAAGDGPAAQGRRIDDDAGREAALGLVLAAEVDDQEVQRQRADRQIQPAQPQRRQAEHDAEQRADERRGRQRDPERGIELLEQDADREGAGRQQPGVAERDLACVAGQQHERERADAGQEHLVGEIEQEGRGQERKCEEHDQKHGERPALGRPLEPNARRQAR